MSNVSDFIIENGVLTKYVGPGGDVMIPEGVTQIDQCVFERNNTICSVCLPETLRVISRKAFYDCALLEEVNFPENLEEIDRSAFAGCTSLKEAILPRKMERISDTVFADCTGLKKLVLPEVLHDIGEYAFSGLDGLEEFTFTYSGDDDWTIKLWATYTLDLDSLAMYYLKGIIRACPALDNALFKRLNTKTNRKKFFHLFLRGHFEYLIATFLTLIPKMSPEELDEYIQAADSVPEVRTLFLNYKERLYPADMLAQLEEEKIEKELGIRERTLADWKKIYKISALGEIKGYKGNSPVVEIPYSVGTVWFQVGAGAFKHCEFLETVIIAERVTLIDNSAFNGCIKLREISIPSTITKIGASAFKNCVSLTHVTFPGSIANIGSKAFEGCINLVIHGPAGSKIIKYAEKNNIPFVAE